MPEPWIIHFFRRHRSDDATESVPAMEFLRSLPAKAEAEIVAVLKAVADAPPPAFWAAGNGR